MQLAPQQGKRVESTEPSVAAGPIRPNGSPRKCRLFWPGPLRMRFVAFVKSK